MHLQVTSNLGDLASQPRALKSYASMANLGTAICNVACSENIVVFPPFQ